MPGFSRRREAHVLEQGEMRKYRRDLKRSHQPPTRDGRGTRTRDLLAVEENLSAGWCQEMREEIEASGLAGAVGTDQRVDGPALDRKSNAIDGDEAFELLGQPTRLEYRVIRHAYVWGSASRACPCFNVRRDYPVRAGPWQ